MRSPRPYLRASDSSGFEREDGDAASAEEDRSDLEQLRVEQLRRAQRLAERHQHDLAGAQRDHLAEAPVAHGVHRRNAEAGRQHAVERGRGAAALDVPEDRVARLVAGALLDLGAQRDGDTAEPGVAEGVRVSGGDARRAALRVAPSATTTIE